MRVVALSSLVTLIPAKLKKAILTMFPGNGQQEKKKKQGKELEYKALTINYRDTWVFFHQYISSFFINLPTVANRILQLFPICIKASIGSSSLWVGNLLKAPASM